MKPHFVTISAAIAGLIGAFASKILQGSVLVDGTIILNGAWGANFGAFIASFIGIICGRWIQGKTKLDINFSSYFYNNVGGAVGLLVGPPISEFYASN